MSEIRFRSIRFPRGDVFTKAADTPKVPLPPQGQEDTVDTSGLKRFWLDLPYGGKSQAQNLALFLPNEGAGPFPLVILIHGGGFLFGDKFMSLDALLRPCLAQGFAVASVNYRLSGEAKFPAAIEDVKTAVRYLKASSERYSLNPERFALWGESSGGNLAALAGTTHRTTAFVDACAGYPDVSTQVAAVVDFCGPIDFLTMDDQFTVNGLDGQNHNSPDSFESLYLGAPIATVPWLVKQSDPQTYLAPGGCPPFLIEHGTKDENIPYQQSVIFSQKLLSALDADKVNLRLLDGATHCSSAFESDENIAFTLAFLKKYLDG